MTVLYPYKDGRGADVKAVKACADVSSTSVTVVTVDGKEIEIKE